MLQLLFYCFDLLSNDLLLLLFGFCFPNELDQGPQLSGQSLRGIFVRKKYVHPDLLLL